eukprot:g22181.t1
MAVRRLRAGGFTADVFNHAILSSVLFHLRASGTPWTYVDPWAGKRQYDEQLKAVEVYSGLRRGYDDALEQAKLLVKEAEARGPEGWWWLHKNYGLYPYFSLLAEMQGIQRAGSESAMWKRMQLRLPEELKHYPSTWEIVRHCMRPQDRAILVAQNESEYMRLKEAYLPNRQIKLTQQDPLKLITRPRTNTGLAYFDMGHARSEEELIESKDLLKNLCQAWPWAYKLVAYPIHGKRPIGFVREILKTGQKNMMMVELYENRGSYTEPYGMGMVLVNPPDGLLRRFKLMTKQLQHAFQWIGPNSEDFAGLIKGLGGDDEGLADEVEEEEEMEGSEEEYDPNRPALYGLQQKPPKIPEELDDEDPGVWGEMPYPFGAIPRIEMPQKDDEALEIFKDLDIQLRAQEQLEKQRETEAEEALQKRRKAVAEEKKAKRMGYLEDLLMRQATQGTEAVIDELSEVSTKELEKARKSSKASSDEEEGEEGSKEDEEGLSAKEDEDEMDENEDEDDYEDDMREEDEDFDGSAAAEDGDPASKYGPRVKEEKVDRSQLMDYLQFDNAFCNGAFGTVNPVFKIRQDPPLPYYRPPLVTMMQPRKERHKNYRFVQTQTLEKVCEKYRIPVQEVKDVYPSDMEWVEDEEYKKLLHVWEYGLPAEWCVEGADLTIPKNVTPRPIKPHQPSKEQADAAKMEQSRERIIHALRSIKKTYRPGKSSD